MPSETLAVSAVTLNVTSIVAGASGEGTVSLTTAAANGGTSVLLSSSNSAVVSVQTPVMVPAGSSTATFSVTAIAAGTATITASVNGSSRQSPALTVTPGAAVATLSLSAPSVVGGDQVTDSVSLTAPAQAGGAVVALSGGDPVTVPASVTVPAGATTATFMVSTRVVGGTIPATITASYGGASASAVLSVTKPTVAIARFGVSGPNETETCSLTDNGNAINCTFNGTLSTAPGNIIGWDWTFGVAKIFAQTSTGSVLTMPAVDCSLVPPPPLPAGTTWFTMIVTLKVRDDLGNVSAEARNEHVRLFPSGTCGY